jgi:hypothetical protein
MRQIILLFIVIGFFSSCKKNDTNKSFTLPPKTQTGKHTFGFLLNSNVWTNYRQRCTFYGCSDNLVGFYYSDGDVSVSADRVLFKSGLRNSDESISFSFPTHFTGSKTYSTLNGDSIEVGYRYSDTTHLTKYYVLSATNPVFNITITKIDALNKILSGEFSGKLFRRINLSFPPVVSQTDSINVTEGRFDIKLK